jgi:zinc transport system substrate-binding protein
MSNSDRLGRRGMALAGCLLSLLLVPGCGETPPPPTGRPLVVASFYPIWDLSREIAGDRAEVAALVPPGVEPHDWEPAPRDLARLQSARVFVYNGAGFEPWAERVLAGGLGRHAVAVKASEGLPLLAMGSGTVAHESGGPPAAGGSRTAVDPHVWLDPVLARTMAETIRAGLEAADPTGGEAYRKNAAALSDKLTALHRRFESGLAGCARREVVASHAALGYLARRYGFAVVPIAAAPGGEPSPSELAAVVRFARRAKVQYILSEPLLSPRMAEALAREVGASILVFDPIEGVTAGNAAGAGGYVTLMDSNLEVLRVALGCR